MGSRMAAGKILIDVYGIGVACKDHVACMVSDTIVWVFGNIVKELVDSVSGSLGGHGLLEANDTESNEKFFVNPVSIP